MRAGLLNGLARILSPAQKSAMCSAPDSPRPDDSRIAVTDEMRAAGAQRLLESLSGYLPSDWPIAPLVAEEMYRLMAALRPESKDQT